MAESALPSLWPDAVDTREAPVDDAVGALMDRFLALCDGCAWDLAFEPGAELWARTMEREGFWANPCFVPGKSRVDEANAMSLLVTERATGRFIAACALRFWWTDSFLDVIESGEVYYDRASPLLTRLPVARGPGLPDASGVIGYCGGNVVSPALRGARISLMTTRFIRLLAETTQRADHHTGLCFYPTGADTTKPNHHFSRVHRILDGLHIPDRDEARPVYYLEMTREEFLAQTRRDVLQLARDGKQDLSDLALLRP